MKDDYTEVKTVGTVTVDLATYNEFVISQYENGKLRSTLSAKIKELRNEEGKIWKELNQHKETLLRQKSALLEYCFNKNQLSYYSRETLTDHAVEQDGKIAYGYAFMYPEKARTMLFACGITHDDMVAYIHGRVDEYKTAPDPKE